jgi:hypothetical protein
MHQRLPAVAAWICLIALPLGLAIAAGQTLEPAATPSADAAKEPVHGLLGHYYTRDLPGSYDLKGFLPDEYGIPVPNKQPNAIRVDAQIAFGKGKGFVRNDAAGGSQLVWWAPAEARAAVWKGYIRLPVAGTYYLTTASSGASAVYLNSARVSLNGGFGGSVPSDKFSLGETGTGAANSPNHRQYVVPIPVTGPRVLPIEVRHLIHDSSGVPRGIDLYWVRPDAPRDASGKAVAQIVPTEVLFTQAPEPVDKPKVRGANSMISSDFLYLSAVPGSEATVTVRLADEKGRPVAGHRVHVTTVQSPDGGSSPDEIIQPLQSTDENGIVTAKLRATGDQHGARLFATDLTDFVDVAQVADVIFERRREWSLRPAGFAPYYDSKAMTVEPLPLRVGQPTKLTILLANRTPDTAEVTAAFLARETNIGGVKWDAVGKAERITLAPGESRKVSVTWIPQKPDPHVCFKVDMTATFQPSAKKAHGAAQVLAAALGASSALAASAPVTESLQQNIGPVTLPPCGKPEFGTNNVPFHPSACVPSSAEKFYCNDQVRRRQEHISRIKEEMRGTNDTEYSRALTEMLQNAEDLLVMFNQCAADPPDPRYKQLAAAASDTPAGYLAVLTTSMERYQGAEAAGDREWMGRHLTAQRLYLRRHAEALRRAGDAAQKRAEGLPREDPLRTVLLDTATLYRESADEAERVPRPGGSTGVEGKASAPVSQTFVVGNPHDRTELVDLTIRRVSIPVDWKLSIVNAPLPVPSTPAAGGQKKADSPQVSEIRPGQRYQVTLPAKTEVRVASVVVPVGETGENTTARWAVEGRIGNELLGGIVHEMHVPAILADLQLPPIGSAATTAAGSGVRGFGSPLAWLAAAISVLLAGILFIAWRRKRSRA